MEASRFALIGAAGYIAPRHMKAIRETGNSLVAACDPHDSVGVIDSSFPEARFFTEIERFDRHLEKLRRKGVGDKVDYVTICTPNYLHDAHVRLALRVNAHAICEKPLVINPWNLEALAELEAEHEARVFTILQLRLLPRIVEMKQQLTTGNASGPRLDVVLSYVTRRGAWYGVSWKGSEEKSGGVAMNIGIHFFDLVIWLFGAVENTEVHVRTARRMAGTLELERARVRWFLSLDEDDLPAAARAEGKYAYRSMTIDGAEIDLSPGFTDLHTQAYEGILGGQGPGIKDARPSIQTVYDVRQAEPCTPHGNGHPFLS